jgi:hypothetical protein
MCAHREEPSSGLVGFWWWFYRQWGAWWVRVDD